MDYNHQLVSSLLVLLAFVAAVAGDLVPNYYAKSCPRAESIVAAQVAAAFAQDKGYAARLLRLHFHDCFVRGCDGSVLLDSIPPNLAEKDADINFSLAAFEVVDAIKAALEAACPGVVSCADLLALAAREAVKIAGGPYIPMLTGRLDGFVSLADDADNHIPAFDSTHGTLGTFRSVGLSTLDLVSLSGAHTIGVGHCTSIFDRLPPAKPDGLLDLRYRGRLAKQCGAPNNFNDSTPVNMDFLSPTTFDNKYYAVVSGKVNSGLFVTDGLLGFSKSTKGWVSKFARNQTLFFQNFVTSMLKMSAIGTKGQTGEVRFDCRFTNQY